MKTIRIKTSTKDALDQLKSDELKTMDSVVNMLLDNSIREEFESEKDTNIHLNEDTLNRLRDFKAYEFESYDKALVRLISQHND